MIRLLIFNSLAVCLALITGCSTTIDTDNASRFQDAEQAFVSAESSDDYLAVASQYQQILDSGFRSGAILYNQGNAFLKANQPGRAIAAYRQAKRFRPGDPLLDSNLRSALSKTGTTETPSIVQRLLFWQNWISYGGKFVLTTVLLGFAVACFVAAQMAARRMLVRAGIICGVLTVVSLLSTGLDWYRFDFVKQGVVISDQLIARKGAADSYDAAFTEPLPEGTEFVVTETVMDWIHIQVGSAGNGWVPKNSVVVY